MKKILLSLSAVLAVGALNAQIYTANDTTDFQAWSAYDMDGDSLTWIVTDLSGSGLTLETQAGCAISNSWVQAGPLTPDNVLVSPMLDLSGETTVYAQWAGGSVEATASGWHEEHYAVYVANTAELTAAVTTATWPTPVWEGTLTAGEVMEVQNADISSHAGQADVMLLIRHYNCTDENFLVFDDVVVSATSFAGIEENTVVATVYPNPATSNLTISLTEVAQSVELISLEGQVVASEAVSSTSVTLNVSNLKPGVYFYAVTAQDGTVYRDTFVKK